MTRLGEQCARCKRYMDSLTDDAEPHPVYPSLCVSCGAKEVQNDRTHGLEIEAERQMERERRRRAR